MRLRLILRAELRSAQNDNKISNRSLRGIPGMERIRKIFSVGGCRAEESVMVAIRCDGKKDALLSYGFSYLEFAITVKGARFDGKEAKKVI